jgi:TonB family protein
MARLTKASKPKLSLTDKRRRHADPPALWLAVATGSVVFHVLLAVLILPLQAQRAGEGAELDPVAIDFVEVDPVAEAPEAPVAIAPNSTQSDVTAQQPEPQSAPPAQSIEAFPSLPPEPEPTLEPSPAPPQPPPEPPQAPVEEVPAPESPTPESPAPAQSEQPVDSPPENLDSSETGSDQVADADNATADPSPADGSASAEGGDTNPDSSSTSSSGLPGVTVDANASPTGLMVRPVVSQRSDRPFDLPTQLATIKPGRDRLPDPNSFGCPVEPGMEATLTPQEQYAQYLAEANAFLGTSVNVNVTVEADGRVSEAQIGAGSGNNAYDQLAVCLVENWLEFNPALREGAPWASDNQQVTIIISSIQ